MVIPSIGNYTIRVFSSVLDFLRLVSETLFLLARQTVKFRLRGKEIIEQLFCIGVQSLPVVGFSLLFITLMLLTEFSFHVKLVLRQDSLVPAFSTVLMIRELGPVITSLLLASRVGAAIAAEVGTMKITEQLDALKLLAIHPIEFLVLPRWIACIVGTVSLSLIALGIGVGGGALMASGLLGSSKEQFLNTMFVFVRYSDIWGCVIKAAVFGSLIPLIASWHGFHCRFGSQGVGNAATAAVVHSSVLIIVADFVLTYLLYAV